MNSQDIVAAINELVDSRIEVIDFTIAGVYKYKRHMLNRAGIDGAIKTIEFLRIRLIEALEIIDEHRLEVHNTSLDYEVNLLNTKIRLLSQLAISAGADPTRVTSILNHEPIELIGVDNDTSH